MAFFQKQYNTHNTGINYTTEASEKYSKYCPSSRGRAQLELPAHFRCRVCLGGAAVPQDDMMQSITWQTMPRELPELLLPPPLSIQQMKRDGLLQLRFVSQHSSIKLRFFTFLSPSNEKI